MDHVLGADPEVTSAGGSVRSHILSRSHALPQVPLTDCSLSPSRMQACSSSWTESQVSGCFPMLLLFLPELQRLRNEQATS